MSTSEQRSQTPKIALASGDASLAKSREELLRTAGYDVQILVTPSQLVEACKEAKFDLLIVGHSLEYARSEQISVAFREHNAGSPILQLQVAGSVLTTAEYVFRVDEGPDGLLRILREILRDGKSRASAYE